MTPREIVAELDRHIVGQASAKRAVAIALRNRWRWRQLPDDIRREVTPKNILMIGPTGVGKTEITRRLAQLTGAPFVKVEATKYTEVGYYGRDVESVIRDLVEAAITLVRNRKRQDVEHTAKQLVEDRLLELLIPDSDRTLHRIDADDDPDGDERVTENVEDTQRRNRTREKFRRMLQDGQLEERMVELTVEPRSAPVQIFSNMGMEQMDLDLQGMMERMMPKQSSERRVPVSDARRILLEQETDALMDRDAIQEEGLRLAEDTGVVFIDEIDKICGPEDGGRSSADVSRQGVQRDLLPIVEGTSVQTKYGHLSTEQILFIAAGAFHRSKPSDLMPELQGRFPIRVELEDLSRDDFVRILTEPSNSLTRQYTALLETDGVKLTFKDDGVQALAEIAYNLNHSTQNIGARRLQTVLERLLDRISFEAPNVRKKSLTIDADYVREQLEAIVKDEDLSRFIL